MIDHIITEMKCGTNLSYIFDDNRELNEMEYKVMQNQAEDSLMKGVKMLYNGKLQIYYLTGKNRPLSSLPENLEEDRLLMIAGSLLSGILKVKDNGFLSVRKLELSFEKIFVDLQTGRVRLIYLPVETCINEDEIALEEQLRAELFQLLHARSESGMHRVEELLGDLKNSRLSLEEIYMRLRREGGENGTGEKELTEKRRVYLTAINAPEPVSFEIRQDEFVIGKKESAVDGALTFSRMISRIHCKISWSGKRYGIIDLDSVNGTFLNKRKLIPGQFYPISDGDEIRIAKINFQVAIR